VSYFALTDGTIDVYLTSSTDPARVFSAPVRLTDQSFDPSAGIAEEGSGKHGSWWVGDYQGLALGGGHAYAVWNDTRTGTLQLFAASAPIGS
jgi:hypothetical protein